MIAGFGLAYWPRPAMAPALSHLTNVAVLEDPDGRLTYDEVRTMPGAFVSQESPNIFRSHSESAFWIRCTINAPTASDTFRYLKLACPNMEDIDVWFEGVPVLHAGKKVDVRTVPVKSINWYFPVPLKQDPSSPVFIRVHSSTILQIPMTVVDAPTMIDDSQNRMFMFGIMFGILGAVLIVNLFSFLLLKRKIFITYSIYLFFLILYHYSVHGFMYFIPMPYSVLQATLWIGLSGFGIFMTIFAQQFMNLKSRLPTVNRIYNFSNLVFVIQAVVGACVSRVLANQIAYITGMIVPVMIISTVIYLYRKGHRELRYYLVAWCALLTATVIWAMSPRAASYFPVGLLFMAGTSLDSLLFTLSIFELIQADLKEREEIKEREKYYLALSRTDSLTGLYNRRYLSEIIKQLEKDNEMPAESALIMIDIDNFKAINDNYGHLIGDIILTRIGTKIKKHIRKSDIACRYGGDEFLVLLPGAKMAATQIIAEEIMKDITEDPCYSETGEEIHTSVSIGLTETRLDDSFDGMFLRADAALYQAKKMGRNRIAIL